MLKEANYVSKMASSDSDQENQNGTIKNSQQRKLCYRGMLNKIESMRESEDLSISTVQNLGDILKKVNALVVDSNINERYQHPDETLLDSMVLSSASHMLVKCIEAVDVNSATYEPSAFANHIKDFVKQDDIYDPELLLKLVVDVKTIVPEMPDHSFVYGAYDMQNLPQPKQKKQHVKEKKEKFVKKQPEKVSNMDKGEKGIEEIVKNLYAVLDECYEQNGECPINYYDYVIDTDSFGTTVENMFYCSFLVRDGRAHIDLDGKGQPFIKPVKSRALKQFRDEGGFNSQMITAFTIPEWEGYKKQGYLQKYKLKITKKA